MKYFVLSCQGDPLSGYSAGKGLSLYIETSSKHILYGLGSGDTLVKNAIAMGVDLRQVDTVVLPEARMTSCSGLTAFLERNQTALIYARPEVWEEYYHRSLGLIPCGIKRYEAKLKSRFVPVNSFYAIDTEIVLFDAVKVLKLPTNYLKAADRIVDGQLEQNETPDKFDHELSIALVGKRSVDLVTAGSHSGLENLLTKLAEKHVGPIRNVVGSLVYVSHSGELRNVKHDLEQLSTERNLVFYLSQATDKKILRECKGASVIASGHVFETK